MGEVLDVAQVTQTPNRVDANVYDREYSAMDDNLSSIKLVAILKRDAAVLAHEKVEISDGSMGAPMKAAYETARAPVYDPAYQVAYDAAIGEGKTAEEAKAAGRSAGNDAVIAAGIVRADPSDTWAQVKALVAANETAANLVKLLASRDWGVLMLRAAWKRAAAR